MYHAPMQNRNIKHITLSRRRRRKPRCKNRQTLAPKARKTKWDLCAEGAKQTNASFLIRFGARSVRPLASMRPGAWFCASTAFCGPCAAWAKASVSQAAGDVNHKLPQPIACPAGGISNRSARILCQWLNIALWHHEFLRIVDCFLGRRECRQPQVRCGRTGNYAVVTLLTLPPSSKKSLVRDVGVHLLITSRRDHCCRGGRTAVRPWPLWKSAPDQIQPT